MKRLSVFLTSAALAPFAAAQTLPHPADPAAKVPAVKYQSAFEGYVPYREHPLAPWREMNDEVARVRGHPGIFGGAGHAGHGGAKPGPSKPAAGQAADSAPKEPAGRPSARGAPKAPSDSHKGH